ncbi:MAG: putative MFS-type transporter YfcJ [Holosporales bacterium]
MNIRFYHFFKKTVHIIDDHPSKNRTLWSLSFVCLLWSISSCMVFSLLPTFITEELKLSTRHLGWIEGIAISLAFIAKVISGILSDHFRKRKPLLLFGTLISFLFKSFFALATNGWWIFFAKSLDRFAKGIRSSPVDALIADIAPAKKQATCYGVRQSLYTFGAVIGSILASFLFTVSNHNYRFVFWFSLFPILISLVLIIFYTKDFLEDSLDGAKNKNLSWKISEMKSLKPSFWHLILVSFILMLSRFSESFLALKGREVGIEVSMLPIFIVIYELMHSCLAYPIGLLGDRFNKRIILFWGITILCITNGIMYSATSVFWIFIGYLFAGLHMGVTHGLLSALIAENTPSHLRGTAFSVYYFSTGIAILLANPLAGHLAHTFGRSMPFMAGGVFSFCAAITLLFIIKNKTQSD